MGAVVPHDLRLDPCPALGVEGICRRFHLLRGKTGEQRPVGEIACRFRPSDPQDAASHAMRLPVGLASLRRGSAAGFTFCLSKDIVPTRVRCNKI